MKDVTAKQLPSGWEWKTMEDIADVIGGGTPKSTDSSNYDGGDVPWLTPADLSGYTNKYVSHGERFITKKGLAESSARMMPKGTVLFTSRAPIGYVVIASNPICTNQGFKSFVIKDENVIPEYVYWWLKGNKQLAESMASGTTFLELNGAKAKQLPIPIAPPEQQKQIVAKIEELFSHIDAGIAALKQSKQLLKQYRQSVLKAAVTGELSKEWREQNKAKLEPASKLLERILQERRQKWEVQQLEQLKAKEKMPKDDGWKDKYKEPELLEVDFEVPEGWVATTISQVAECLDGIRRPINKHERQGRMGDVPYYGANGPVGFIDDYLFDEPLVLVVEDETFVGRTLPFTYKIEGKSWVNNHAHVLRATDAVLTDYLNYSLMYYPFTPLTTGSTGRRKLTQRSLNAAPYPLPPMEEQVALVGMIESRLSGVERLLNEIDQMFIKAEKSKQSVLQSAFDGELV